MDINFSTDAHNMKRRRPPDGVLAFSANLNLQEAQPQAGILDSAIWLSGPELKHRVIQFYSGSRTSKKRK
jgi:hypothetical protein